MEQLFPYQNQGVDWLSERRHALLADEMGLGKSAQAIRGADNILAARILVVCPAVARINWAREFKKFSAFTRRSVVLEGADPVPSGDGVAICSYDYAVKLADRNGSDIVDLLIIDEAHFVKSQEAKRTHAVFGKKGLARKARVTWAITGTPMPNNPSELWVMLTAFGRVTMGYEAFCNRYCEVAPGYRGHVRVVGSNRDRMPELKALLAPVMLRRTVKEVLPELPDLMFGDVVVAAGAVKLSAQRLAEALAQEAWLKGQMLDEAGNITPEKMRVLEALANSVSTLRFYNGLQKVNPVHELVRGELDAGAYSKVVIFAVHREVITNLTFRLGLSKGEAVSIHGGTSSEQRQANIDRFQTDPLCKIIVCNIQAAGTAINLTAASQVIFVESEWSPGANAQAVRRCRRIGSTRNVMARFISIADSIDEKVTRVVRRKTQDINILLDDASF